MIARTRKFVIVTVCAVIAGVWLPLSAASGGGLMGGGEQEPDRRFRSLDEISSQGAPRITNITDSDAVLIYRSDVPLACSVVYGKTTDYGLIATDQDMGGGAHRDHQPLMAGLEPDTVYHYRLQGTAADGTIYMSGDGTFETLPASETVGINLASREAGAVVIAVSSNYGNGADDDPWGALNAFDGRRDTAWSSAGDGDSAYVTVKLKQRSRVHAIEVQSRAMSDGTAVITSFTITTDGGETYGPFELGDPNALHRFDLNTEAQSLRFDVVSSTGGNTGLVEFAVYGEPVEG
jgi:hypothetical protein